jgi:hypothetical protein
MSWPLARGLHVSVGAFSLASRIAASRELLVSGVDLGALVFPGLLSRA